MMMTKKHRLSKSYRNHYSKMSIRRAVKKNMKINWNNITWMNNRRYSETNMRSNWNNILKMNSCSNSTASIR